jgi:hypothetical protein
MGVFLAAALVVIVMVTLRSIWRRTRRRYLASNETGDQFDAPDEVAHAPKSLKPRVPRAPQPSGSRMSEESRRGGGYMQQQQNLQRVQQQVRARIATTIHRMLRR